MCPSAYIFDDSLGGGSITMHLPVIDPHLHFSGCLTPGFIARAIQLPEAVVRPQVIMQPHDERSLPSFLGKFDILQRVPWTVPLFRLACEDVGRSLSRMVDRCWLRVSVGRYAVCGLPVGYCLSVLQEVMDYFCGIGNVRLLLALQYENRSQWNECVANDLIRHGAVCGVDMVGNEAMADMDSVLRIVQCCTLHRKIPFAHAGESLAPDITWSRISRMHDLGLRNVCHGVSLFHALPDQVRNVWFHVAPTSNRLTGAVRDGEHPVLRLLNSGHLVTIGADDPTQCQCTTREELAGLGAHSGRIAASNAQKHWDAYAP